MKNPTRPRLWLVLVLAFSVGAQAARAQVGTASGLAGRAWTIAAGANFLGGTGQFFEWYQYVGTKGVPGAERVELSFAIIPFAGPSSGATWVGLDSGTGGTFLSIPFRDGLVNEALAYDPSGWNRVIVTLDFPSQTYRLAVNDAEAGPFPFVAVADSLQALRVNYSGPGKEQTVGWIDAVLLTVGTRIVLQVDFDQFQPGPESLCRWCEMKPARLGDPLPDPCCVNHTRPPTRQEGWAGRAESGSGGGFAAEQYFEWVEFLPSGTFGAGADLEVSFSIMPFVGENAGPTWVGLDGTGNATFLGLGFEGGLVNGTLPYRPNDWNQVKVTVDYASQTFQFTVNGVTSEPVAFGHPSQTASAFRVNYSAPGIQPAVAWLDSLAITSGSRTLLTVDFDRTLPRLANVAAEAALTVEDPTPSLPPADGEIAIITAPKSQTAVPGQTVTFEVRASGLHPLRYQWEFNGMPIADATEAVLVVPNVSLELQGSYSIAVTDALGAQVKSEPAILSLAQPGGTVQFANRVPPGVDAPVFAEDGQTPLEGERYLAQLYAGPSRTRLTAVGPAVPFRVGAGAGYWRTPDSVRYIPTVTPGETAFVQARVWEVGYGTTFEQTLARGGPVGLSEVLAIVTGGAGAPPSLPPLMSGLGSFQLTRSVTPELAALIGPAVLTGGPPMNQIALSLNGRLVQVAITSRPGEVYQVESSSDLIQWQPSGRAASLGALLLFQEFAPSSTHQFYRVIHSSSVGQ